MRLGWPGWRETEDRLQNIQWVESTRPDEPVVMGNKDKRFRNDWRSLACATGWRAFLFPKIRNSGEGAPGGKDPRC